MVIKCLESHMEFLAHSFSLAQRVSQLMKTLRINQMMKSETVDVSPFSLTHTHAFYLSNMFFKQKYVYFGGRNILNLYVISL